MHLIPLLGIRLREDRGATAVEYAIMAALIAVVIIAAVILIGQNLANTFQNTANTVGGL